MLTLAPAVPPRGANPIAAAPHLDANRMPAAVFFPGRRIAEIVLLAQFVGDAARRRIEVARFTNDLGAAAAVVGHVAQRRHVDRIVAALPPRPAARLLRRRHRLRRWPAPTRAEGKRAWDGAAALEGRKLRRTPGGWRPAAEPACVTASP